MKKFFTSLITGSLMVTAGIEVKANTANSLLQSFPQCTESNTMSNYDLLGTIGPGGGGPIAFDLAECYGLQNNAINTNVTDIDTNTSNISTNTSNISTNTSNISTNSSNITTNTSAIQTLQGSSSNTSDINKLGEGVAGSTALTAALSALPQLSEDSKITCGVGTGVYSSRYAVGFGCASKVSERVAMNAGGSYVFGGSKSYGGGTLDSGVVKAGFVFKLGELDKPTEISLKDKKIIDNKISNLQKDNKNLKAKNDEIISQNKRLLARLEKLENIALKFQVNNDVISMSK